jgi:hypothetical protein
MAQEFAVPHGDEKVVVELTVKEALALAGIHFHEEPELLHRARKKLRSIVTEKMLHS